jgi:hypothetical protein
MSPAKTTKKKAASAASGKKSAGFTPEERAAMKERLKELKASQNREEAEKAVVARIAAMPEPDRALAKRVHALITAAAPELAPRLWYGMPAYAKDGKVVCFFQDAKKFQSRYATLGFSDEAKLDDGSMWAAGFALKEVTPADEARITALVKKAVS